MLVPRLVILLATFFVSAAQAEVSISDPWARASILESRPGVAYLTIESAISDRLMQVSTPVAEKVMIHETKTGADGVSQMHHIMALELPAGKEVLLAPGGLHLMLMGIVAKLEEGTSFPMTLEFENAGEVEIEVQVLNAAAMGPNETGQ